LQDRPIIFGESLVEIVMHQKYLMRFRQDPIRLRSDTPRVLRGRIWEF